MWLNLVSWWSAQTTTFDHSRCIQSIITWYTINSKQAYSFLQNPVQPQSTLCSHLKRTNVLLTEISLLLVMC